MTRWSLAALVALVMSGCYVGPQGAFLGAAVYHHREFATDEATCNPTWETTVARTWGTSKIESAIDESSERMSFGSNGISENMVEVVDAAVKAGLAAGTGGASTLGTHVVPALSDSIDDSEAGVDTIVVPPGTSSDDVEAIRGMLEAYSAP